MVLYVCFFFFYFFLYHYERFDAPGQRQTTMNVTKNLTIYVLDTFTQRFRYIVSVATIMRLLKNFREPLEHEKVWGRHTHTHTHTTGV